MATTHQAAVVDTKINFFDPENPTTKVAVVNGGKRSWVSHDVSVRDARLAPETSGLDKGGFLLIKHGSQVQNFRNPDEVQSVYLKEVGTIIQDLTNANLVIAFHGQIRDNSVQADPTVARKPAHSAHADYVENSFRKHARRTLTELGEDPDYWLAKRFSAYNVWRSLVPVEELPLAVCDGRSIAAKSWHVVDVEEKPGSRDGLQGLLLEHDPAQQWYYYSNMQPNEALVFKQCDSDHDRVQRCAHTAITVPDQKPALTPRVSFDIRTMAFFA